MKDEIEQQVDYGDDQNVQEEKFTGEQVKRFIDAYRETKFPRPRSDELLLIIQNSGLSRHKARVRHLATGLANRLSIASYRRRTLMPGSSFDRWWQYDPVHFRNCCSQ